MSRARYLKMWIVLLDLAGLALSYFYGTILTIWSPHLPSWLIGLGLGGFWLLSRPFLVLPASLQKVLLANLGLMLLTYALLIRLLYLVRYACRRWYRVDLGVPYARGPRWEVVQRRFADYQTAVQRWNPPFVLKTPSSFRYYKRQDSRQPDMFWRGRMLVIEHDLLTPERVQDLAWQLARQLAHYNSHDVDLMDVLSYYPEEFSFFQFVLSLTGLCFFFPVILFKWMFIEPYWEQRTLVIDKFTYELGQGHAIYYQIQSQLNQQGRLAEDRLELRKQMNKLRQEKTKVEQDKRLTVYDEQKGTWLTRSQEIDGELQTLERRHQQLILQEELTRITIPRPMYEHRLEQLAALLNTEISAIEQLGVSPASSIVPLFPPQEPPRQLPSGAKVKKRTMR